MLLLGISAYYHDSAAALIRDGEVLFAAQEERFSRKKNDDGFPGEAIRFCMAEANADFTDLHGIAFYDKPFLKFERILENYYQTAPFGLQSFLRAMPAWLGGKLNLKATLRKELRRMGANPKELPPIYFPEHHLSHAASAFYPAAFDEGVVLSVDGVGEYVTTSICYGKGNQLERLRSIHYPHSIGLLYAAVTYYLGFRVNSGEYKVMGLAAYGQEGSDEYQRCAQFLRNIFRLRPDGSFNMDKSYFRFRTSLRMTNDRKWEKALKFPRRTTKQPINSHHENLALAVQKLTEETLLGLAKEGQRLTGSRNICLAGGVALNCVANSTLLLSGLFDKIFVQPAAGDAGGAIGAALATYYLQQPHAMRPTKAFNPYLGPFPGPVPNSYTEKEDVPDFQELCRRTARLLAEGKVVAWVQDRMEFGPRALGNRSILADPRPKNMKDHLNLTIKEREPFRPFAPAVPEKMAADYFRVPDHFRSPHMLFTFPVKATDLPAITHVDGSARLQTVSKQDNSKFYQLLQAFYRETGCPVLLNTSFNGPEEPIVATAAQALDCFNRLNIDILIINQTIFNRKKA